MAISFQFREYPSAIFGKARRPLASVLFQNQLDKSWKPVTMVVDTGADYTLLPRFLTEELGINLKRDCKVIETQGVGGTSRTYLLKKKISVRLGDYKREIPVGFLNNDYIPPLLGRQEFLETFKVVFEKFVVSFE